MAMHARIASTALLAVTIGVADARAATATAPATTTAARPTEAGSAALSPEVAALIERLNADDVAARDEAQEALLTEPGEETTAALRALRLSSRDPDVRMRLDTLLAERAEQALIGASRITLRFDDVPLLEALATFSKATGAQFDDSMVRNMGAQNQAAQTKVTLDLRDVSYWQALTQFADAAGIGFQPRGDRVMYVVRANQGGRKPFTGGVEAGPFYIQPVNATYSRSVSFMPGAGVAEPSFNVQIQLTPEPKLRLANQHSRAEIRRAVDSKGNDLAGRAKQMGNAYGSEQITINLPLSYPKDAGDRIAELSGSARLSVATRLASIDIADVLNDLPVTRDLGGVRVEIRPAPEDDAANRNNNIQCAFVVTITRDNTQPNVADRVQQAINTARLTDAAGNRLQLARFQTNQTGDRTECQIAYSSMNGRRRDDPTGPSGPFRWQADMPVAFRDVDVPFTFRDLPMP